MDKEVVVLGTVYTIKYGTCNEYKELKDMDGFTDTSTHTIIIDDMSLAKGEVGCKCDLEEYRKEVTRHELIHALLNESGLANNSTGCASWATNEEMVDWIAIQFSKIHTVFVEAECI